MNILLYDDHNFVTEAVANFISQQSDVDHVDRCHSIEEVKKNLQKYDVDILVSDVLSDEDAGFSLFEYVAKYHPDVRVVVYSSLSNKFIIDSLLEMGVFVVVNKKEPISVLWENILKTKSSLLASSKKNVTLVKLTNREKEIVTLLAQGLVAKEIAEILGSSPNTINNQKNTMLEKFDCLNSTELVVKLSQMGLISIH